MRKLLLITLQDLRVYFSERGNLVGLIVLPLVLTITLGLLSSGGTGDSAIPIDWLDNDESSASESLSAALREANDALLICPADAAEGVNCAYDGQPVSADLIQERVNRGTTDGGIVVPAGYGAALAAGDPVQIAFYTLSDPTGGFSDPVFAALDAAITQANSAQVAGQAGTVAIEGFTVLDTPANIIQDDADRAAYQAAIEARAETLLIGSPQRLQITSASNNEEESAESATNFGLGFGQAVPGQGVTFVMFTVLGGMAILVREREQWTLQRLVVSPLTRWQIIGGKVGGYFVLGMIQFSIVFAVGVIVGVDFGDDPLAVVAVMMAFVLAITSMAFAIATQLENQSQVSSVSLLIALTFAPLGGAWWPLSITPEFMQVIGHLTPVAWAMDAFQTLIFFGGTLNDIWLELGVLLAFSAVLFVIGVTQFKYET